MRAKKAVIISFFLVAGLLMISTYTAEAKYVTINFEVLEQAISQDAGKEWIDEDWILHWKNVVWEFILEGDDLIPLKPFIATARTFQFSLITGEGGGTGTNYFYGICMIEGYEGLIIEWSGTSVMTFSWAVYGKYVSHGTLGNYKIKVTGEFFPSEIPDWTTLIGEIKIYI